MTSVSQTPIQQEVRRHCEKYEHELNHMSGLRACIQLTRDALSELLLNRPLMTALTDNLAKSAAYPDINRPTLFDNELVLFQPESRSFSLRMYLWGPGEYVPPHDHNSWGVIGTVTAGFETINYRREDDGTKEGYARLSEVSRRVLQAAQAVTTLPLNDGIHETGNPTEETLITLSIYGPAVRRGYIQGFDIKNRRVYKMVPPRQKKILLATQTLRTLKAL